MGRVTAAIEGQDFKYQVHRGGKLVWESTKVKPSCGGKDGNWACVTHGKIFPNQLEKDFHIADGDHVLVWICLKHGPEVP